MEINIAATILQQHSSSQDVLLVYVVDLIVLFRGCERREKIA